MIGGCFKSGGLPVPGGCADCRAYQVLERQPGVSGIWHLRIVHHNACPTLARRRGRVPGSECDREGSR